MAPNAPIGAAHMIMARILKTSRSKCLMPRRIACPEAPRVCTAKPMNSATNSVCSTISPVSGETSVVGMIPSRNSVVDCGLAAGRLLARGLGRRR